MTAFVAAVGSVVPGRTSVQPLTTRLRTERAHMEINLYLPMSLTVYEVQVPYLFSSSMQLQVHVVIRLVKSVWGKQHGTWC